MNESGPVKRPIKTARAQDSASLVLLRREYELSCNLQHPFIAPTFAFLEDSPVGPAILREYIEGATLRDFVASEPSKSVRSKILGQILAAVEYIHSVRGTFVKNYASYRESLPNQEQRFVCDTVYGRLVVQLSEQMRDLPVL